MIPISQDAPLFKKIAVILGDPRKADQAKPDGVFSKTDLSDVHFLKATLAQLCDYEFSYLDNHETLIDDLRDNRPDFVLNFCDNGFGNHAEFELHVPALLEILDIPYSGAGPHCLSQSFDKGLVGAIARSMDLPVPQEKLFTDMAQLEDWRIFPAIIKPSCGDNSFGITKNAFVRDMQQLKTQMSWLKDTLGVEKVLVQEFLPGREINMVMLGNPESGFLYLPAWEWVYTELPEGLPNILTQDLKFSHDPVYNRATEIIYADIAEETLSGLRKICETMFARMDAHDYAKLDFRADASGNFKLLEFNPNPSWNSAALADAEDAKRGYVYKDVLHHILQTAQRRYAARTADQNNLSSGKLKYA